MFDFVCVCVSLLWSCSQVFVAFVRNWDMIIDGLMDSSKFQSFRVLEDSCLALLSSSFLHFSRNGNWAWKRIFHCQRRPRMPRPTSLMKAMVLWQHGKFFVLIVAVVFDYQTIEDVCSLWVGTVVGINWFLYFDTCTRRWSKLASCF